MNDNKSVKDYFNLLNSGITDDWDKDKEEFIKNENFRNKMDAIGSKKHKIPAYTMTDFEKRFEPLKEIKIEPKQEHLPTANQFPWPELSASKVTPILVLYLNVVGQESISDALDYALNSLQITFKESGWAYLILPITDGRDSFIESHSVERLDPIELKQLETKILKSIKTGE